MLFKSWGRFIISEYPSASLSLTGFANSDACRCDRIVFMIGLLSRGKFRVAMTRFGRTHGPDAAAKDACSCGVVAVVGDVWLALLAALL